MLYNVYRPKTFDEVIGQPATTVLENMVKSPAHSILITGTRGVGKTTLARIFAQALNCSGDGTRPCRRCKSCRVKDHPDIVEVDSAVFGDPDAIEPLVQRMSLLPTYERKVVIFDEAHTISRKGMSMLLKTVEEPSSRTVVILVTTEPEKIDKALRSRCMWLQLRNLSVIEITGVIAKVAQAEGINVTKQAAIRIAEYAQGSLREALSILDVVHDYPRIDLEQMEAVVGHRADVDVLISLLRSQDVHGILVELNKLCLLYEAKLVAQSIMGELLVKIRQAVEAQQPVQGWLDWFDAFRRAKVEMATSYDQRLCLEVAVVDVVLHRGDTPPKAIMMNDWPAFVAYVDSSNSLAARHQVRRLKFVRLKGETVVLCKRVKVGRIITTLIEKKLKRYLRNPKLTLEVI